MKYRTIGTDPKTRREVSVLSLGTMHFGTATDEATSFVAALQMHHGRRRLQQWTQAAWYLSTTRGGTLTALTGCQTVLASPSAHQGHRLGDRFISEQRCSCQATAARA
jgi:hypothetical protein